MPAPISSIRHLEFRTRTGFSPLDGHDPDAALGQAANTSRTLKSDPSPVVPHVRRPKHFGLVSTALCLSEFARAIDAVVLPVILPGIVRDLGANTSQGYLSGSSFLLCQTVFQPVWAGFAQGLSDKSCMLVAFAVFAGASVLTGFSQNPDWMIGARALQGAGAGGMDMLANIMITKMVSLSERGKFAGLLQLFGATGLVSGMILASVIQSKFSWRWVFFINPFVVVGPAVILAVFYHTTEKTRFRSNMKNVDWGGMALVNLSCVGVLYGLLTGGVLKPWASVSVLLPLLLGSLGTVAFVLYEAFVVEQYTPAVALMPMRLFSHRTSATGYIANLLHSVCIAAFANFFFIYLHVSSSLSILSTSLVMLPSSGLLFTSAAIAGYVTSKTRKYRMLIIVGGIILTAGFASFIPLRENASRVEQLLLQILFAAGAGIIFPARLLAAQAAQKPQDETAASATISFIFNLGQCFGIPIGATTYESVWDRLVEQDVKSGVIPTQFIITSKNAEASGEIIRNFPPDLMQLYRRIMAVSISNIWILTTAMAGVIILAGIIMKEVPLDDVKRIKVEAMREVPRDDQDDSVRFIGPGA